MKQTGIDQRVVRPIPRITVIRRSTTTCQAPVSITVEQPIQGRLRRIRKIPRLLVLVPFVGAQQVGDVALNVGCAGVAKSVGIELLLQIVRVNHDGGRILGDDTGDGGIDRVDAGVHLVAQGLRGVAAVPEGGLDTAVEADVRKHGDLRAESGGGPVSLLHKAVENGIEVLVEGGSRSHKIWDVVEETLAVSGSPGPVVIVNAVPDYRFESNVVAASGERVEISVVRDGAVDLGVHDELCRVSRASQKLELGARCDDLRVAFELVGIGAVGTLALCSVQRIAGSVPCREGITECNVDVFETAVGAIRIGIGRRAG